MVDRIIKILFFIFLGLCVNAQVNQSGYISNSINDTLTDKREQEYINPDTPLKISWLKESGINLQARQGIAFYEDQYYSSGGTQTEDGEWVFKYNQNYDAVDSVKVSLNWPAGSAAVGDVYVYQDSLYVPVGKTTDGWILVYDLELNYSRSINLLAFHCGSVTVKDGLFWVSWVNTGSGKITSYNSSWTLQNTYTMTYSQSGTYSGYEGIGWFGDYLFGTSHAGTTPDVIDVYYFNGISFEEIQRMEMPNESTTQGIWTDTVSGDIIFAERNFGGTSYYDPISFGKLFDPSGNHYTETLTTGTDTLNWNFNANGLIASLSANSTINIHNIPDGKSGSLLIIRDATTTETLSINGYSGVGAGSLTTKTIGTNTDIVNVANKASTVTYKRFGDYLTIIYGHEE